MPPEGTEQEGHGEHAVEGQEPHALAEELEDAPHAAAHAPPPQQLQDDVLGLDPRPQAAAQLHSDHARRRGAERLAGQAQRHVQSAGADGQHAEGTGRGGVTIGADQHLAGPGEALQVEVVADAIARRRVDQAIPGTHAGQVAVVVLVLPVQLEHVVVDVLDRERHANPLHPQRLELEASHGPRVVLQQHLVRAELDLVAGLQRAARDM